jgi:ketosteroid isomerase-like protein
MTDVDTKAVIDSFYRSRLANDVSRCLAHMAPEATIRIAGSPDSSPIASSSKSPGAMRQHVAQLVGGWDWHSQKIHSVTIQDDRAAIHYELTTTFKPTNTRVTSELIDLLTVRDGKITSYIEFVDTALVANLASKVPQMQR